MTLLNWLGRAEPERDDAVAVFHAFLRHLERLQARGAGEGPR
jgi:hypothetical protein